MINILGRAAVSLKPMERTAQLKACPHGDLRLSVDFARKNRPNVVGITQVQWLIMVKPMT